MEVSAEASKYSNLYAKALDVFMTNTTLSYSDHFLATDLVKSELESGEGFLEEFKKEFNSISRDNNFQETIEKIKKDIDDYDSKKSEENLSIQFRIAFLKNKLEEAKDKSKLLDEIKSEEAKLNKIDTENISKTKIIDSINDKIRELNENEQSDFVGNVMKEINDIKETYNANYEIKKYYGDDQSIKSQYEEYTKNKNIYDKNLGKIHKKNGEKDAAKIELDKAGNEFDDLFLVGSTKDVETSILNLINAFKQKINSPYFDNMNTTQYNYYKNIIYTINTLLNGLGYRFSEASYPTRKYNTDPSVRIKIRKSFNTMYSVFIKLKDNKFFDVFKDDIEKLTISLKNPVLTKALYHIVDPVILQCIDKINKSFIVNILPSVDIIDIWTEAEFEKYEKVTKDFDTSKAKYEKIVSEIDEINENNRVLKTKLDSSKNLFNHDPIFTKLIDTVNAGYNETPIASKDSEKNEETLQELTDDQFKAEKKRKELEDENKTLKRELDAASKKVGDLPLYKTERKSAEEKLKEKANARRRGRGNVVTPTRKQIDDEMKWSIIDATPEGKARKAADTAHKVSTVELNKAKTEFNEADKKLKAFNNVLKETVPIFTGTLKHNPNMITYTIEKLSLENILDNLRKTYSPDNMKSLFAAIDVARYSHVKLAQYITFNKRFFDEKTINKNILNKTIGDYHTFSYKFNKMYIKSPVTNKYLHKAGIYAFVSLDNDEEYSNKYIGHFPNTYKDFIYENLRIVLHITKEPNNNMYNDYETIMHNTSKINFVCASTGIENAFRSMYSSLSISSSYISPINENRLSLYKNSIDSSNTNVHVKTLLKALVREHGPEVIDIISKGDILDNTIRFLQDKGIDEIFYNTIIVSPNFKDLSRAYGFFRAKMENFKRKPHQRLVNVNTDYINTDKFEEIYKTIIHNEVIYETLRSSMSKYDFNTLEDSLIFIQKLFTKKYVVYANPEDDKPPYDMMENITVMNRYKILPAVFIFEKYFNVKNHSRISLAETEIILVVSSANCPSRVFNRDIDRVKSIVKCITTPTVIGSPFSKFDFATEAYIKEAYEVV